MAYESVNPYSGQRTKQFAEHTSAEVEAAVTQAQACFTDWQTTTFVERAAVLSRAALILRSQTERFAKLITEEMGKLIAESRGEVTLSANIIDYYAQNAGGFLAPQQLAPHSGEATI